jgi:hypothetical protein
MALASEPSYSETGTTKRGVRDTDDLIDCPSTAPRSRT